MKKILFFITFISSPCFAQSNFALAPRENKISWKGSNVVGGSHEGKLTLASGTLIVSSDGRITGGSFVVDMTSIRAVDEQSDKGIPELDEHLKSEDFFAVSRFPKAFVSIGQVDRSTLLEPNQYQVVALLTIKGITNQISFPASIEVQGDFARIKTTMTFNRTKWDIVYQSANFLANLKDTVISDNIEVSFDLRLTKGTNK